MLDEATAFADPENEALMQEGFAKLSAGRTVLMIAHRLSTVVNADKIVVIADGQVVEQGSHDELVQAEGLYAHMWAKYQQAATWQITVRAEADCELESISVLNDSRTDVAAEDVSAGAKGGASC